MEPGLLFSNLYFGAGTTATQGSTLGIEVTNDDAFYPGGSGTTSLAGTGFSFTENAATGVITLTLPWSFPETDPLSIGFEMTWESRACRYPRRRLGFSWYSAAWPRASATRHGRRKVKGSGVTLVSTSRTTRA